MAKENDKEAHVEAACVEQTDVELARKEAPEEQAGSSSLDGDEEGAQ
jgi:hypothetical protein